MKGERFTVSAVIASMSKLFIVGWAPLLGYPSFLIHRSTWFIAAHKMNCVWSAATHQRSICFHRHLFGRSVSRFDFRSVGFLVKTKKHDEKEEEIKVCVLLCINGQSFGTTVINYRIKLDIHMPCRACVWLALWGFAERPYRF